MKTWIICATGALALTTVLDGAPIGVSPAQEGGLTLPLRLSAFAVSMSNVATGKSAVMDIRITRWSTQAEREALITTAVSTNMYGLVSLINGVISRLRRSASATIPTAAP